MVIDLLFVGLLLASTALLISGKPLNIHITHTHKVEDQPKADAPTTPEQDTNSDDAKDIAEFIQDFLGVTNEE